jgi:transcriptional regulator with XRE-family HTH domain
VKMDQATSSVNVVNRVRQVARLSGISLLEISRTADVSYSMLRRISQGRGNLCLAEAVAVASALGVPVESIFVLDEPLEAPGLSIFG